MRRDVVPIETSAVLPPTLRSYNLLFQFQCMASDVLLALAAASSAVSLAIVNDNILHPFVWSLSCSDYAASVTARWPLHSDNDPDVNIYFFVPFAHDQV
ncbi:hypothetical protein Zmor_002466 [Zophobas morio]|uniref:Uncharacterized protein n=1 Tax=Zophobas morio TaxID=2755281 RepID=A0AA38MU65_9CUCU|nr:hypothetical protein Zmor_002466 [Zophobas morio]